MSLEFEVQKGEFVQVLHSNEIHYVTASNIGCPVVTLDIFDCIQCTGLSFTATAQITALLFTDQPEITVCFQPVQVQCGTNNCGVFCWFLQHLFVVCKPQHKQPIFNIN